MLKKQTKDKRQIKLVPQRPVLGADEDRWLHVCHIGWKSDNSLTQLTGFLLAAAPELQPQHTAGSAEGGRPPGGGGVRGDGRELPRRTYGHRRVPRQLHGEEDGESGDPTVKVLCGALCSILMFVVLLSSATAEELKRRSCSSPSTHMDRSLPATRR